MNPFRLAVVFTLIPVAACLCGDGSSKLGYAPRSGRAGAPVDDSRWPSPTPPNGGAAAASNSFIDPIPAVDAGVDTGSASNTAPIADAGAHDAGAAGHAADAGQTTGAAGQGAGAAGHGGGACGCDAGPKAKPPLCQFDNQCGSRARCRDGACERECRDASTCGTGQVCAEGYCQTVPGGGGKCVYDRDCGAGATCFDGACHARCGADAPCGDADRCVDGVCQPEQGPWPQCLASSECGSGQACVNAVCRTPCDSDADCCTGASGSSGSYCRAGVCVTAHEAAPQCRRSTECGAQACIDGACS
jgi:hypothetical protein